MKRIIQIIKILLYKGLLIAGVLLYPSFNGSNQFVNYWHYIVWGNDLNVSCSNDLELNKVQLVFENESAMIQYRNFKQANRIVKRYNEKIIRETIFIHGKQLIDIPYDYGKQRILVYYNSVKIGELVHWRTNYYHVHTYEIRLIKKGGKIMLEGRVKGPDQFLNYIKNEKTLTSAPM